jgi:deoxyribonuclease V
VHLTLTDPWPATVAEALAVQDELRPRVVRPRPQEPVDPDVAWPRLIAGLDVAYDTDHDRAVGAVVLFDPITHEVVETAIGTAPVEFPYIPDLLAFREIPPLATALAGLDRIPDLLMCDGYGIAHPRRFGIACHLGVLTGLPSIGVAATPSVGTYGTLADERGSTADLFDEGRKVGRALRTRHGVQPVYVSIGHRIDLDTACHHVLALATQYRLPEPIRQADAAARGAIRTSQVIEMATGPVGGEPNRE